MVYNVPNAMLNKRPVLIASILAMIVISAAASFFWISRAVDSGKVVSAPSARTNDPAAGAPSNNEVAAVTQEIPSPAAVVPVSGVTPQLGPKEEFLKMRPQLDGVKSYEALKGYTLKFGSQKRIAEISSIDAMPESYRNTMTTAVVSLTPPSSDITDIKEDIRGDRATLNVSNKSGIKWTVSMVLENGVWKVDSESWVK